MINQNNIFCCESSQSSNNLTDPIPLVAAKNGARADAGGPRAVF
jgi:hypothetical protein